MPKNILIIAGEASGDLYGALLVDALKERFPEAQFLGVGGEKMKASGVDIIYPFDELAVMGVSELLPKLGIIKKVFSLLEQRISRENIDLGILVNYPGFNLRLARVLKSKNIPVVFYSSPQVWIWGKWRLRTIKRFVDKMIVFLKLEEKFYKENGINAEFVGHPLVDVVRPTGYDLGIDKTQGSKVISLVPGSRRGELANLFSDLIGTARIIHSKDKDTQFLITKHPQIPHKMYENTLKQEGIPVKIIDDKIYDCLMASDLSIVVSGSVTLEAAILKAPMIIIYKVSAITEALFYLFTKLRIIGLVNIVAGKKIVPECTQRNCTPKRIASEALKLLANSIEYDEMKSHLEDVNTILGSPGASARAAEIISQIEK